VGKKKLNRGRKRRPITDVASTALKREQCGVFPHVVTVGAIETSKGTQQ
jgi:hypothetical protein